MDRFWLIQQIEIPSLGDKHLWKVSKFYKLKKFFPTRSLSLSSWKTGRIPVAEGESSLQSTLKHRSGWGDILQVYKSFEPKGGMLI